jgi:hypothetical protein
MSDSFNDAMLFVPSITIKWWNSIVFYHVAECPWKALITIVLNVGNTNQNIVYMDAFGKYGFYTLFEPKKSKVLLILLVFSSP